MIIVDNALGSARQKGKPIRVGMIGAGFMAQGLTNQIVNSVPGMRDRCAVYNRRAERAVRRFAYAGTACRRARLQARRWRTRSRGRAAVDRGRDRCSAAREQIDVLVDVDRLRRVRRTRRCSRRSPTASTSSLMNAELDATIGPILQRIRRQARRHPLGLRRRRAGRADEPLPLGRGLGLTPRVIGERQGPPGSLPEPDDAAGLRREVGPEPRDGHLVRRRLEDQLRAGDRRQRHRLQGARARDVARTERTTARSWISTSSTTSTSCASSAAIVDYTVGPPGVKIFCLAEHADPKQRHYLELYKMGPGPALPVLDPVSPRALRGAERHRPGRALRRRRCAAARRARSSRSARWRSGICRPARRSTSTACT